MENVEFKSANNSSTFDKLSSKIPKFLRSPKVVVYLLLVVSLPTTVVLAKTVQDIRQRASELPPTPPTPPTNPTPTVISTPTPIISISPTPPLPTPTASCSPIGSDYKTFCSGNYLYASSANGTCGTTVKLLQICTSGCTQISPTEAKCVTSTTTPTPTVFITPTPSMCPATVISTQYSSPCKYGLLKSGYKKLTYKCSSGFKGTIGTKTCSSSESLLLQAKSICAKKLIVCK